MLVPNSAGGESQEDSVSGGFEVLEGGWSWGYAKCGMTRVRRMFEQLFSSRELMRT
jgi:hypothetical protein